MAREESSHSGYAKVRKETVLACLTCSLCSHIFSNPTTITECLHIFCKQCIHDKIIKENCSCCPKCNTDIGANPLSKLRPDHHLNEIRNAFFDQQGNPKHEVVVISQREENIEAPVADKDVSSSLPPPPEIIEESFSSMALGASRVPTAATIRTKKRSKSGRKRRVMAFEGPTYRRNEASRRSKDSPVRSSSPKHTANPANSNPQSASSKQAKAPEQPSKGNKEGIGLTKGDISSESPTPVNTTGAGKTNLLNIDLNNPPPESPSPPSSPVKLLVSAGTTTSERPRITRRQLDKAPMDNASIAVLGDSDIAVKRIPDHKQSIPMWFSLVQERRPGVTPLPGIKENLKVEFEECLVLHIKKYIAQNSCLPSEEMVDVYFDGQVLDSAINMCDLLSRWTKKLKTLRVAQGASAKELALVLTYARSMPPATPPSIVLALPCPTARPQPRPRRSA